MKRFAGRPVPGTATPGGHVSVHEIVICQRRPMPQGKKKGRENPALFRSVRQSYSAVALATSIETPGPMVELRAIFFM